MNKGITQVVVKRKVGNQVWTEVISLKDYYAKDLISREILQYSERDGGRVTHPQDSQYG